MDLIEQIEYGLGRDRLNKLKKHDDDYQIFWVGVLEHRKDVDINRDPIPYLISCGYGAIRNEILKENTKTKIRYCPCCGKEFSYRKSECPHCKTENITDRKIYSTTMVDGSDMEFEQEDYSIVDIEDQIMVQKFINTLYGREKYVAKRWLVDRADLKYNNHCKQLAMELGCSAPYVARLKKAIRNKWKLMYAN